jgi:hypothetical protein
MLTRFDHGESIYSFSTSLGDHCVKSFLSQNPAPYRAVVKTTSPSRTGKTTLERDEVSRDMGITYPIMAQVGKR